MNSFTATSENAGAAALRAQAGSQQWIAAGRRTGAIIGAAVRDLRDARADLEAFVRRHPVTLCGAAMLGYGVGRLIRGRRKER